MSLKNRMRNGLAAPAVMVALLGVGTVGAMALVATPAYAQTTLSMAQVSSIKASLSAAIAAANGDQVAVETAISEAMSRALVTYGYDAAGSVASAIIAAAEQSGAPSANIGNGLAKAAASINATYPTAAQAIARTIANEGRVVEVAACQTTAMSLGQTQLAQICGSSALPTAETTGGGLTAGGNAVLGGGFTGGGAGGGSGGTCLNASCTK
jgi:hypothetical protein